jgi:archaellum component FlaC
MNNISALNHVFIGINQSVTTLNQRINGMMMEMEAIKKAIVELRASTSQVVMVPEFEGVKQEISAVTMKIEGVNNSVEEIKQEIVSLKDTPQTPSLTIEEVQGMIDNAVNSLINVLTSASSSVSSMSSVLGEAPLPTILETPLEPMEPIDELKVETSLTNETTETTEVDVQPVMVTEPSKKKGVGKGRKTTKTSTS